ncbi:sensor histidine kinase [Planotetraspora kaengkrachanensis]|uniref:histidine kinase n=1 Tax=Planotetraspora kaengkrachanensis TaxID=575193 RepID=A0A8J3PZV6_9ACTN|nr:HAMP domain-containing sensor histidine kinase [Planotetraspora kaengkrachanensis]GIG83913.1 two-component sensor histidine kinase [Planotetraspora kaengkrachanensis]
MGALVRAARELLNWRSLRWKIAALVAAASCAVALSVGLLVHRSTFDRTMSVGQERAFLALQTVIAQCGRGGDCALANPDNIPPSLLQQVRDRKQPAVRYDDSRPGIPWMWAAAPVDGDVVAVQTDMGADMRALDALDRNIVEAALAALAVVVPLAALAAEPINRRLRRVARTAGRIADGDLDARIGTGRRARDEITGISSAVDSMAGALQGRLLAEQRFTADVAHELRTPLMGLTTASELLPEGEATDLVRDRVRVLRTLVESLLEISRLDAGAERAERAVVPLSRVVEDSVHRTGLRARLSVTGDPVAQTDPRRLDRIIANLVVNAHRHGGLPVEVSVDGTTITVRDHGPGFPRELLAEGPQRFRTGAAERGQGHGLGLTIALGQAQVIGAELIFGNAPDGGAVAVLRLPGGTRSEG